MYLIYKSSITFLIYAKFITQHKSILELNLTTLKIYVSSSLGFAHKYRQIEDNFELDLRNRAFLSELDSKELKDNELERLTMFSIVDSLDSVPLHTKTTPLSFKHKAITLKSWVEIVNKLHSRIVHFRNLTCQLCDGCPVLNDIEWRDNCQFPVIHKGETPSDWMKRIWDQLMNYRKNNCLFVSHKRYMVARKILYLWEGDLGSAFEVNIAICHSCDQLVYSNIGCKYGICHFMDKHWSTNCTGNAYCDISFRDYIEFKNKLKSGLTNSFDEKQAIRRYELWMQNAIRRVKRAREIGRKIRAVKVIQEKWLEYFYRPDGLCASELALHYQLLWTVREEMLNIAICHSCDQLVYSNIGCKYGICHFMDKHWSTNCTGNAYCDISFRDYIEFKNKLKSGLTNSFDEKQAIRRYELWMQNAIRRVKRAREIGRKIRAVKVIQEKWLEYFYRPDGLCASELALHYQLLWTVREEMRQINNDRSALKIENNLSNNYIMVNQEIQTSDTIPICTCEHADEINRYIKKELNNLSRELLENSKKTFGSLMQEITKQFEEQVNINNKLRSEIDRQKLLLQDMEIKLASLKSRSTY
ncbi:hypothetical protein Glove_522g50 [Diversispora epigaea]|uniref:Uncharacterized protein n=1 Tax=Diversispora epigaea TaxID=1348612 RepID=A0A397GFX4_9GLOM|nr:hypothetical protein Glove_522g50 [Diversispora epigaea]